MPDLFNQLHRYRSDLSSLTPARVNWGKFDAFVGGFRAFLRLYYPGLADDFNVIAQEPAWTSEEAQKGRIENGVLLKHYKEKLSKFIKALQAHYEEQIETTKKQPKQVPTLEQTPSQLPVIKDEPETLDKLISKLQEEGDKINVRQLWSILGTVRLKTILFICTVLAGLLYAAFQVGWSLHGYLNENRIEHKTLQRRDEHFPA